MLFLLLFNVAEILYFHPKSYFFVFWFLSLLKLDFFVNILAVNENLCQSFLTFLIKSK